MKIAHLGIAVKNLADALAPYEALLGGHDVHRETVEDQGVAVAMLPVGESHIELLEPTRPDSPIAKFLASRGEGLHHVCFEVDDIEAELARLKASGVRLIDQLPRAGANGCRVAFIHPKSTSGVLIELSQPMTSRD